jgi:hypothetical protein
LKSDFCPYEGQPSPLTSCSTPCTMCCLLRCALTMPMSIIEELSSSGTYCAVTDKRFEYICLLALSGCDRRFMLRPEYRAAVTSIYVIGERLAEWPAQNVHALVKAVQQCPWSLLLESCALTSPSDGSPCLWATQGAYGSKRHGCHGVAHTIPSSYKLSKVMPNWHWLQIMRL